MTRYLALIFLNHNIYFNQQITLKIYLPTSPDLFFYMLYIIWNM